MGVISSPYITVFLLVFLLPRVLFSVQSAPYTPKDNYLIACGSTSSTAADSDGRQWMGDESPSGSASSYLPGNPASVAASTSLQDPNLPSTVPFLNARIFTSPENYSFPVTPGRHWLRLFFYPFAYENYDPNNAIVTVQVDSYYLITNMSILRETQALNYDYIQKEYSINVTSSPLLVSFIPGRAKNAFAMVNGIELVSMPDDLFADSIYDVDILVGKISRESLNKFAETAENCLRDRGSERPTMGDVLWSLEYALELHESSVEKALDNRNPQIMEMALHIPETSDLHESSEVKGKNCGTESYTSTRTHNLLGEDSDDASISALFSELVNSEGR